MVTGVGAGGGLGGGAGFEDGEDELPEDGVGEVLDGGSLPLLAGAVELPPQPASASTVITAGATHVVVVLPCFIVLISIGRRLVATTDRDTHQLFP